MLHFVIVWRCEHLYKSFVVNSTRKRCLTLIHLMKLEKIWYEKKSLFFVKKHVLFSIVVVVVDDVALQNTALQLLMEGELEKAVLAFDGTFQINNNNKK